MTDLEENRVGIGSSFVLLPQEFLECLDFYWCWFYKLGMKRYLWNFKWDSSNEFRFLFSSIKATLTTTDPAKYSSNWSLSDFTSNSKLLYEPILSSSKLRWDLPPKVYNLVSVAGLNILNLTFSFLIFSGMAKSYLAFWITKSKEFDL